MNIATPASTSLAYMILYICHIYASFVQFARLDSKHCPLLISKASVWRCKKPFHHDLVTFPRFLASLFAQFELVLNAIKFSWTATLPSMRLFISNIPSDTFKHRTFCFSSKCSLLKLLCTLARLCEGTPPQPHRLDFFGIIEFPSHPL